MGFGFWVLGFGFWVSGLGFWVDHGSARLTLAAGRSGNWKVTRSVIAETCAATRGE